MKWLALFLTLSLFVSGCSKITSRQQPKAPVGDAGYSDDYPTSSKLEKIDIEPLKKIVESQNIKQIQEKVIPRLRRIVLDAKHLDIYYQQDPTYFRDALGILNDAILYMIDSNIDVQNILTVYEKAVTYSCDQSFNGGCPRLRRFSSDPDSTKILQFLANKTDSLQTYYYRVYLGSALKNFAPDSDLEFLLINRAKEVARQCRDPQASPPNTCPFNAQATSFFTTQFHNIVQDFDPSQNEERFRKFLSTFQVWDYSNEDHDLFGDSLSLIFDRALEYDLYDSEGQLNPSLSQTLEQTIKTYSHESPIECSEEEPYKCMHRHNYDGVDTIANHIKDNVSENVFTNLGIPSSFPNDEYFYLMTQLFHKRITPPQAESFWKQITKYNEPAKAQEQMLDLMEGYIKLHIFAMVLTTTETFKAYLDTQVSKKNREALIKGIDPVADSLIDSWDELQRRIQGLSDFLISALATTQTYTAQGLGTDLNQLQTKIDNIKQSVKMMSIVPTMLMNMTLMAQNDYDKPVDTFWGSYEKETITMIHDLFALKEDAQIKPWYKFYQPNLSTLNAYHIMEAFYFALATESFSRFDQTDLHLGVNEFYKQILNRWFTVEKNYLIKTKELYQRLVGDSSAPARSSVTSHCQEEYHRQKDVFLGDNFAEEYQSHTIQRDSTVHLGLGDLQNFVYLGIYENTPQITFLQDISQGSVRFSQYGKKGMKSLSLHSIIQEIRQGLMSKLRYAEQLHRLTTQHLQHSQGLLAGLDATYEEIVDPLQQDSDYILKSFNDLSFRYSYGDITCEMLLIRREQILQQHLIDDEKEFLGSIHDAYRIDSSPLPSSTLNEKSIKGYTGFDKLNGETYMYSKMDLLVRLKRRLETKYYNNLRFTPPYLDSYSFYTSRETKPIELNNSSREQFIAEGMSHFFSFVNWREQQSNLVTLAKRKTLDTELYKTFWYHPDRTSLCKESNAGANCPTAKRLAGIQIKMAKLISLTPKDKEFVGTRSTIKYKSESLKDFIFNSQHEPLSPLDVDFYHIYSDELHYDDSPSVWFMSEATRLYKTVTSQSPTFFSPTIDIYSGAKDNYSQRFSKYLKMVKDYLRAVQDLSEKEAYKIDEIYYSPTQKIDVGGSDLISTVNQTNFESLKGQFQDETNSFFVEEKQ